MGSWVIVGCGFVGTHLARALVADGIDVIATRSSAAAAATTHEATGARTRVVDLTHDTLDLSWLPPGSTVVDSVPPRAGLAGQRHLVRAAAQAGAARLVALGSIGVYPDRDAWVDETTPPDPPSARGRERLAWEQALRCAADDVGLSLVILRLAALYGPGRGIVARLRSGTLRRIGPGDTPTNRIHVDDVVQAIRLVAAANAPSPVYDVADGNPTTTTEAVTVAARHLGIDPPPITPLSAVTASVAAMVDSRRRVSADRLRRELGWRPRWPTFQAWLDADTPS